MSLPDAKGNVLAVLNLLITALALMAAGGGFRAAGGWRPAREAGIPGAGGSSRLASLLRLAVAALVTTVVAAWLPFRPLALLAALVLASILGAATAIIAELTLPGSGKWRLRLLKIPVGILAAITTVPGGIPVAVTAGLLLPVTLRMPWLDRRVGLKQRAGLFVAALLALPLGGAAASHLPPLPGGLAIVLRFTGAAVFSFAAALVLQLLVQFPGRIFDRFRLRTRLVTSYIFVAAIPALLLALSLVIAASLSMGSYRAGLAARLLAPGEDMRRELTVLIADPRIDHALAGAQRDSGAVAGGSGEIETLIGRHLKEPTLFIMAARRALPDTTRFAFSFAPRAAVPPEVAALSEPLPPTPEILFITAGGRHYMTTGVVEARSGDEIFARAFVALDSIRAGGAARVAQVELNMITSDSMTVEAGSSGLRISFSGGQEGTPVSLVGTEREMGGAYSGAQLVRGLAIDREGNLRQQDAMLVVKMPIFRLLSDLRDTAANPLNTLVLWALAVVGVLFLLFEAASVGIGASIARSIHGAIGALNQGTHRLAEDDLDHRIEIDRGDELGELASAFNTMAQGLKDRRRLAVEREMMKSELLVAQSIQRRLFPTAVPDVPGLDVAGSSIPSREIGGDAYDFLRWGDGLLVSVADVAGKGVPAALLMSNFHAGLRGHTHRPGHLDNVLSELNDLVLASTEPGRFITVAMALISPVTGHLVYASAGHNPPFIRRASGGIEVLSAGGLLLGVRSDAAYQEVSVPFARGDVLALYTDGVVEAVNERGEFFGDERLQELLARADDLAAIAIRDRIIEAARTFTGEVGLSDDLTVVIVRRT